MARDPARALLAHERLSALEFLEELLALQQLAPRESTVHVQMGKVLKKLGLADNADAGTCDAALVDAFKGAAPDKKAAAGDAFVAALNALEPEKKTMLVESVMDSVVAIFIDEKSDDSAIYDSAVEVLKKLLTDDQLSALGLA